MPSPSHFRHFAHAAATMLIVLAGCDKSASNTKQSASSASSTTAPSPKPTPAPDNTATNTHNRNAGAVTPVDQGNSESDIRITADIRKMLVADATLSTNAQNCKIVAKNGVVTLRGPVATATEKDLIGQRAAGVAGVTSVVNELEIAPPKG